jgi:hypothetical protein
MRCDECNCGLTGRPETTCRNVHHWMAWSEWLELYLGLARRDAESARTMAATNALLNAWNWLGRQTEPSAALLDRFHRALLSSSKTEPAG